MLIVTTAMFSMVSVIHPCHRFYLMPRVRVSSLLVGATLLAVKVKTCESRQAMQEVLSILQIRSA